ncbi:hypothetical protein [Catellatospora sp. NPDC049133]|uniref:hypothetical protein n=1 Tax=Catellatospora sp. NPDC049133 TaxID=3155499 RepID=UPI0033C41FD9
MSGARVLTPEQAATGGAPSVFSVALGEIARSPRWRIEDLAYGIHRRGLPLYDYEPTPQAMTDDEVEEYVDDLLGELRKALWHQRYWLITDMVIGARRRDPALGAYAAAYVVAQARASAWSPAEIEAACNAVAT